MSFAGALWAVGGAAAQRTGADAIQVSIDSVLQLPAFCDHVQGSKSPYDPANWTPAQARWVALMGQTFHHIHHYCWALTSMMKARNPTISPQDQRAFYASALKDISYVLERAPADFVLLPEIYLRAGQANFGLGDVGAALEAFERSRRAKPDYWPAYVAIAKANLSFGRRQEAEAALQAGLSVTPDEPNLKRAQAQLSAAPAGAKKGTRN